LIAEASHAALENIADPEFMSDLLRADSFSFVCESSHRCDHETSRDPEHILPHPYLAAAYSLQGESGHAAAELAQTRNLASDDRYSSIARLQAVGPFEEPEIRALFEATYFAGLGKAGMPER
jgi:hypothetical protein